MSGLMNRYCGTLMIVMVSMFLLGAVMALNSNWFAIVPIFIGVSIASGFTTLKPDPKEVGLLTFIGKKTTTMVEGLTLLFRPFGWEIIGLVKFDVIKIDFKVFPLSNILCADGNYLEGEATIQGVPKFAQGVQLNKYADVGRGKGVEDILDGVLQVALQTIVTDMNIGAEDAIKNLAKVQEELRKKAEGGDPNSNDDLMDMGIEIFKMTLVLRKPQNVITAEKQSQVTKIMNDRILKRKNLYIQEGATPPSIDELRKQVLAEDVATQGNYNVVEGTGRPVNFITKKGGN